MSSIGLLCDINGFFDDVVEIDFNYKKTLLKNNCINLV